MAWAAGIAASAGGCLAAQTLDRVVASIGLVAITASDVEQEYRFARFLDAQSEPHTEREIQYLGECAEARQDNWN